MRKPASYCGEIVQDRPETGSDDVALSSSHASSVFERNRRIRRLAPWFLATCFTILIGSLFVFSQSRQGSNANSTDPRTTGSLQPAFSIAQLPALPEEALPTEAAPVLDVTPEEAVKINQSIPESLERVIPAKPFRIPTDAAAEVSRGSAVNCLASAIYYEAATESEQGQRAVAQVVLNRVRHPAYPKSICGVVFQGSERTTGCQFSFTCDGSMARVPIPAIWNRAKRYATEAISGKVEPSVGNATHYHTIWIVPYWAKSLVKLRTLGAHVFYRWSGYWGQPSAFNGRYVGEDLSISIPGRTSPDIAMEYDTGLSSDAENVTLTHKEDPIVAPGFQIPAPKPMVSQKNKIAADENAGTLVVDKNNGTLIGR